MKRSVEQQKAHMHLDKSGKVYDDLYQPSVNEGNMDFSIVHQPGETTLYKGLDFCLLGGP
jgi:hypothetical protein